MGEHADRTLSSELERKAAMHDDQTPVNRSADEAAIRALHLKMMEGWNRGSGEAFAAVFARDGSQIAFDGTFFEGREAIASFHQELFDRWMRGTRLVGQVKDVRFLSPDVALMHAVGSTVMRGKTEPSSERDSIQTLVAVRRGGGWRLAALDNIRVRPISLGFRAFLVWTLTDLLWKAFRLNK